MARVALSKLFIGTWPGYSAGGRCRAEKRCVCRSSGEEVPDRSSIDTRAGGNGSTKGKRARAKARRGLIESGCLVLFSPLGNIQTSRT